MNKSQLRNNYIKKRLLIDPKDYKNDSLYICQEVCKLIGKTNNDIAIYKPIKNEVDTNYLASNFTNYYLPVITNKQECKMQFVNLKGDVAVPSIFIVPLVAFNSSLYRLGYGGGYYDRYFAEHNSAITLKIGLAFALQQCNDFKGEPHDIPLDYIITEHYAAHRS
jgi:5-formyltetrahydrofolate cyclo-ligase